MADLDDDPYAVVRADDALRPLYEEHGALGPERADDPFERLVVAVTNQSVSLESAAAVRERLRERVGTDPDSLRAAADATLRDVGLSDTKARALHELAERYPDGIARADFADHSSDDVRAELGDVYGVGDWTANMFLLFGLGREDVFSVGDLGVRKGMRNLYGHETRAEMREYAERWKPYRSYATRYVWTAQ
ncbi:DNA-3-methyladenine glycosylase II [Halarchaeum solikamskense]|uniref:DNA-3-methyladenine glycosylase family protein n=1 Tax=Halarchaeum nitratireducens TaxID=489913 RepID=UPI001B3B114A|nr:DNA-3-methyladenine glycosylase 2 family protein [Halarchaeum solikamskense]MBP2250596.1 DNA-3-methyladenine glycosylase II [Halarchaeum solikamskense]